MSRHHIFQTRSFLDIWANTYAPVLRSDVPWIHRGYSEFPPEPGNETKYPYVRDY